MKQSKTRFKKSILIHFKHSDCILQIIDKTRAKITINDDCYEINQC